MRVFADGGVSGRGRGPARQPNGVADPAHGVNQRRSVDIDLLAQVADVGLEHTGVTTEVVIPYVVEQLSAAQYLARVDQEVMQQPVFGRGEFDEAAAAEHLAGVVVHLEIAERDPGAAAGTV